MRHHWETFEAEFVTIEEDMRHHLEVLSHSRIENLAELARHQEEKSRFLSWVSTIEFEKIHQDIYAKKQEDTCDWLIKEPKYQEWFNGSTSSLLWCFGKPGIGKSVLASSILKHVTAQKELQNNIDICFAYYDYQNPQLGGIAGIIAALVKQLCRRRKQIPHNLLQIWHNALPPALLGTKERFVSLVEDLSEVYVILDALDECPEHQQSGILEFITGVVTTRTLCRVNIFATSRREMDIAKAFEDKKIPIIQVQAENIASDIEIFAHSQVETLQKGEHGKTLYVTSNDLAQKIIRTLALKADGIMCEISKARKDQLVEDALESLPEGLPNTYTRILERIEAQSPYMKELALNCLAWMIYAQRPLSMEEIQTVLAIRASYSSTRDLELDESVVILEACEVLRNPEPKLKLPEDCFPRQLSMPNDMHTRLGLACLRYISLLAFKHPDNDPYDLHDRIKDNPFVLYATQSFDYHITKCDDIPQETDMLLDIILQQESQCLSAILQVLVLRGHTNDDTAISQYFDPMQFPVSASTVVYSTSLDNIPIIRERWVNDEPPMYALH
ncbi:hypothetical protein EJ04DRAFT_570650 [Polyplosphaeria fusca]|uniref:Nephrocystin 3-like N-terminal domain-containing protein n=1 Tax=Polyplosphaeria fusca TaxID=682080 RepID=A0A9P4QIY0_9PLEO|nr:hypothetical protein EJ04DRAFT_570650 [Polyplosphaeria fusca]